MGESFDVKSRKRFSIQKMGASWVPVLLFTVIWGIVGGVLPFVLPKGPHKSVIQVVLVLTAASCWLFWLCCYMSQMNPLIGPVLNQRTLFAIKEYWNGWESDTPAPEPPTME